jgi:hypothetical protein
VVVDAGAVVVAGVEDGAALELPPPILPATLSPTKAMTIQAMTWNFVLRPLNKRQPFLMVPNVSLSLGLGCLSNSLTHLRVGADRHCVKNHHAAVRASSSFTCWA